MNNKTYFPIKIKYVDRNSSEIVYHSEEIRNGIGFHVLETNIRLNNRK